MNNTNNISARMALQNGAQTLYNAMRNKFKSDKACWDWVWGRRLSPSEVRLEVQLDNTSNVFKFALTEKQVSSTPGGVQFNTEKRLNDQDILIVNEYAIYIGFPADEDDVEWQLCTYPNPVIFPIAGDQLALRNTFYNHGNYSVMVNGVNIIPYRGLKNHLYVPETQQTAPIGAGSPSDQFRGAEDGYITQEANLLLIGNKGYQPFISFPAALGLDDTSDTIRAILIYNGVLAQNATITA